MVNTDKFRGLMAEQKKTGKDMAEALGISANTFSAKMKAGVFNSDEMQIIVDVLSIEDPLPIFFAPKVTQCVTNIDGVG